MTIGADFMGPKGLEPLISYLDLAVLTQYGPQYLARTKLCA